jgi:WD40 repeat protein
VLYAACTGRPPFRAGNPLAVLRRVAEDTPQPVREVNPGVPLCLAAIIARLHAKAPADRYQSAAEVAELLGQPLARLRELFPEPAPARVSRRRLLVAAGLLLAGLGALGYRVGLSALSRTPPAPPPDSAADPSAPAAPAVPETAGELRRFEGHSDPVWSVAFSPDGGLAVSGSGRETPPSPDFTCRLWDVNSGQALWRLGPYHGRVQSVTFSPDGGHVFAHGQCQKPRRWEAATGQEISDPSGAARFPLAPMLLDRMAFSPDATRALSFGSDKVLRLWDLGPGSEVRRWPGPAEAVLSMAFSSDGRRAVTAGGGSFGAESKLKGGSDFTIWLWDLESGRAVRRLGEERGWAHRGYVWALAFSPDGSHVLSGGVDRTARLWDVARGQEVGPFAGHDGPVRAVAFSPDGQRALSGGTDGTVRLWDVATRQEVHRFRGQEREVLSVAFSPDGRRALSGGSDGSVRLWQLPP